SRVLTLDPTTGIARGATLGTTTIVVTDLSRRVEARADVTVVPIEEIVATTSLLIPAPRLPAGESFTFQVDVLDANGNPVEGLHPVYTVENPDHGSISTTGVFTGDKAGVTDVIARVAGQEARATVTVIPGALAQIKVSPDSATLALGGQLRFSAEGQDSRRNTIPGVPITWGVADASMGSITSGGLYTAGDALGVNKVRASAGAIARETVVYQYITETRAPAGRTTVVDAVTTSSTVADVKATTHVVGLAEVSASSSLELALPPVLPSQANTVREAKVNIERRATNVTIMLEIQPGSAQVLPEEVDRKAFEKHMAEQEHAEPGVFISVIATEDGERLDSARLNSLLQSMTIQFAVASSYFEERGLDPTQVRLLEWSEGRLVRADVPARLLTPEPVEGVYVYEATFFAFSSFAFVAKPLATTTSVVQPPAAQSARPYTPPLPLARLALAGPGEVAAGSTVVYQVIGLAAGGERVPTARSQITFRATTAGAAVVEYSEGHVAAVRHVTVLPGPATSLSLEGVPKVYAASKGGFRIVGHDDFGNAIDLGWHAVRMAATGTQTVVVEIDGLLAELEVEVVPDLLARVAIEGPSQLVAGAEATYALAGYDAHGNRVPLRQDVLHVQAPSQAGRILVFYDEGGVSGSLPVDVLPGPLASIKVVGHEIVPSDTTTTFSLEGYDAFGNRVPLQRETLAFEAGPGGRRTYVCYAESDISGCQDVVVEERIAVTEVTAAPVAAASKWLVSVFMLLVLGTIGGVAFVVGRRRRDGDEDQER
ncbi:MAG TPA: hypothetical protein VM582_00990, partial [Candidatus Thermoplasmatota archaeon]|nr:hypothetical protein [Candidatus Thermoplasmatota archaeon]